MLLNMFENDRAKNEIDDTELKSRDKQNNHYDSKRFFYKFLENAYY